mmetsp:Transcript_75392/g.143512  ORF Transcript_75392/g.143512 Transcript_75392/m.143512 type:complete len:234 (-) Transcript_75392:18-719(-)
MPSAWKCLDPFAMGACDVRAYTLLHAFVAGLAAVASSLGHTSTWQSCCSDIHPIEERAGAGLEALLTEDACPFLAAFFSASSPLAQTPSLAVTEQRVAASFPNIRYVKVDADSMGVRAFLQWDIEFLPTYVLFMPALTGERRQWHRWPADSQTNPYDVEAITAFVSQVTKLMPANTSWSGFGEAETLQRGSPAWTTLQAAVGWLLVAIVGVRHCLQWMSELATEDPSSLPAAL